jgi:hypothetical protein
MLNAHRHLRERVSKISLERAYVRVRRLDPGEHRESFETKSW